MTPADIPGEQVRCYGHVFDPDHQSGSHGSTLNGWPPHVWSSEQAGACRHCPSDIATGDQYVCVSGGIIHVACVAALDADLLAGGGA